ncbi:MAG: bacterioferritin [Desulfovibrionales bacterium]|jgi:bacterioferritin|nr:bacterioferritin [Desulfovibrionales bacterium]
MSAEMDKQQRRENVIEVLNKARSMELYALTQYMNQHYGLDSMDYGELARDMKLIAIDEMRHAEQFAERIKDLGGEPATDYADVVQKGQDVRSIYPFDTNLEDDTIDAYNQFLNVCREMGDNVSAKLFETIIDEEQEHYNHFDNVGGHIANLGDVYLSKIAGTSSSTGGSTKGFVLNSGDAAE